MARRSTLSRMLDFAGVHDTSARRSAASRLAAYTLNPGDIVDPVLLAALAVVSPNRRDAYPGWIPQCQSEAVDLAERYERQLMKE